MNQTRIQWIKVTYIIYTNLYSEIYQFQTQKFTSYSYAYIEKEIDLN